MHKQHIYISTFFLKHAKVTLNLPAMLDIKRKKLNVSEQQIKVQVIKLQ